MSELEFQSVSGRHQHFFQLRPRSTSRWQRAAIHLPVEHQRQRVQQHVRRRNHILRQLLFQKAAQVISRGKEVPLGDHVSHQPLFSRSVFLSQNDSVPNAWVLAKRCLDFPELDTESADLDLVVNPAQKFDVPVR